MMKPIKLHSGTLSLTIENELVNQIKGCQSTDWQTYGHAKINLQEIDFTYKAWLSSMIEKPIREEIDRMPMGTYEQKVEIAKWLNGELRQFGLAVKCPSSGNPARLIGAILPRNRNNQSKFKFESVDAERHIKTTHAYRDDLDELEIVPDSVDRLFFGPSGFIVGSVEFLSKENRRARQRTLPADTRAFITLERCRCAA